MCVHCMECTPFRFDRYGLMYVSYLIETYSCHLKVVY